MISEILCSLFSWRSSLWHALLLSETLRERVSALRLRSRLRRETLLQVTNFHKSDRTAIVLKLLLQLSGKPSRKLSYQVCNSQTAQLQTYSLVDKIRDYF
jgi:hypothetical protein